MTKLYKVNASRLAIGSRIYKDGEIISEKAFAGYNLRAAINAKFVIPLGDEITAPENLSRDDIEDMTKDQINDLAATHGFGDEIKTRWSHKKIVDTFLSLFNK